MSRRNNKAEQRTIIPIAIEWLQGIERLDDAEQLKLIKAIFSYAVDGTMPDFSADSLAVSILFDLTIKPYADRMEIEYYTKAVKGAYKNIETRPPYSEWLTQWLDDLTVSDAIKERIKQPLFDLELNYDETEQEQGGAEQGKQETVKPLFDTERMINDGLLRR